MNWKAIAIRLARVICRANRDWHIVLQRKQTKNLSQGG